MLARQALWEDRPAKWVRRPSHAGAFGLARPSNRPWTLLKEKGLHQLWRQDRLDPAGEPVVIYRGAVFMELPGGGRRQTPEQPTFTERAKAEAWFNAETGGEGE